MSIETTPKTVSTPTEDITIRCGRWTDDNYQCENQAAWTATVHSHAVVGGVHFGASAAGALCNSCRDDLIATTRSRFPITCEFCRDHLTGPADIIRNLVRL